MGSKDEPVGPERRRAGARRGPGLAPGGSPSERVVAAAVAAMVRYGRGVRCVRVRFR
jgi:hypothetical protein